MPKTSRVELPARADVLDSELNAYQLTMAGMVFPLPAHLAFNAATAGGIWFLGHPIIALTYVLASSGFDIVLQRLLRRWFAGSRTTPEASGLRRLGVLAAVRFATYTTPTFVMALGGGLPELMFYVLQLATLIAVAQGASALTRLVFWGFVSPLVVQAAALAMIRFDGPAAAAVFISLASLVILLLLISEGARRAMTTWYDAYKTKVQLLSELEAARDQAVAERAAADAAREAARRADQAKSNFLATMSHEIRTPMNGVLGMAQLLKRDETNPAQSARIDVLIDSGEYLLAILNDILDVSKIDAGKLEIVEAPEDLRHVLERLMALWAPRAEERGIALELAIAPDVPRMVLIDALRLRQVLFNLMGNALKFTESGSVQIIAEAAPRDDETVRLHLAVQDTGPGIAPAHLPHLFDRFSQADDSEARRFGGTGLGLAIVRRLVELMGGRVWVESELGRGSIFHLDIPVEIVRGDAPEVAPATTPSDVAMLEPLRVLAVDDNAVNLLVLEQILTSLGHDVARASSGAEALNALHEEAFDLVLTDIQMPGMTGTEMLAALRRGEGPNRGAPVVALTADVTSGGRQRYLDQGFTDHAAKPIQVEDLLAAMTRAVSAAPARHTVSG